MNAIYRCIMIALPVLVGVGPGLAGERTIAGPIRAEVTKVRDGDTVEVIAHIWPQQTVQVAVRLRGIDTPEKRGKCAVEKEAALQARDRLRELVEGKTIQLIDISGDKYFGRVLASIQTEDTGDVSRQLLEDGLAVRYNGKTKQDWCAHLTRHRIWPFKRAG